MYDYSIYGIISYIYVVRGFLIEVHICTSLPYMICTPNAIYVVRYIWSPYMIHIWHRKYIYGPYMNRQIFPIMPIYDTTNIYDSYMYHI